MRRIASVVLLSWALLSCHSTPVRSPQLLKPSSSSAIARWLLDYRTAQNTPAKACALFTALAKQDEFPLHDLAHVRAVAVCENSVALDRTQLPPWLHDVAVDVLLQRATEHSDKAQEMDLAFEKSKRKLNQSEKVKWTSLAIHDAEELNESERAQEFKTRLYQLAPRLEPEPSEMHFLAVAADFRLARQFDKARGYYEKVIASAKYSVDDKVVALKGIRLAYKNGRKSDAHLASAQRLIRFLRKSLKANPRLLYQEYQAEVFYARALWTLGDVTATKQILHRLERRLKGKTSLAELYWLQGRLSEEVKDLKQAGTFYEKALKEHFNDKDLRDKVTWYSAWNERRQGHFPRAIEILNQIDATAQTDFTRQRAVFWLGRTFAQNKQDDEAKKTFERLVTLDPVGYYGLMAHRELKAAITLPVVEQTPVNDEVLPLDPVLADWLSRVDEKEVLEAYLDQASEAYRKTPGATDAGWVVLYRDYAKAGLFMKLFESLGSLTPEQRAKIFAAHPDLLFPQPWKEEVAKASSQFGTAPELIYSIIRQESAFDPKARSGADAFGLMQLLPEIAEALGPKYKITYSSMEDLFDPKTNIDFGAVHLNELMERHQGRFILAVASYNASESVIRSWMKAHADDDSLEFIEDIPYEETRAYVRLVMRNFVFYSLLRASSASIDFPEWLLKLNL